MIFNIQHFSAHDGPGVRTTVFFKGCNLRCYWCHNPESWERKRQIQFFPSNCIGCGKCLSVCPKVVDGKTALFTDDCLRCGACVSVCYAQARQESGYTRSVEELMKEILRDASIYQRSGGGVTFSGGEPLLQSEYLSEVIAQCKSLGIHTAIESAVCVPWENIQRCLPDLFFCDIKAMDSKKHKAATGQENGLILENIRRISGETEIEMILRTPVIPQFNDNEEEMEAIAQFVASLPRRHVVELLPFHGYCVGKYESFHMDYKAKELKEPAPEKMEALKRIFIQNGCQIKDNKI